MLLYSDRKTLSGKIPCRKLLRGRKPQKFSKYPSYKKFGIIVYFATSNRELKYCYFYYYSVG